jgi:hypothetical protein
MEGILIAAIVVGVIFIIFIIIMVTSHALALLPERDNQYIDIGQP